MKRNPEKSWYLLKVYLKLPTLGGRERNVFAAASILLHGYGKLTSCSDFLARMFRRKRNRTRRNREQTKHNLCLGL